MSGEETPAQRNRRLFPGLADFVDGMGGAFGPDVKGTYASNRETGERVGKTLEESGEIEGYWTADQWLHMGQPLPTAAQVAEDIRKAQEEHARGKLGKRGKGARRI